MKKERVQQLTKLALLSAIILIMAFTPLGYLRIGVLEITFISVPVVIGAVFLGPGAGAFLGGLFGLTSFVQCFGMSAIGTMFLGVSPLRTFVMCVVPRLLMGWLVGLLYRGLSRAAGRTAASGAASLAGPVLNTLLYMPATFFLFQKEWMEIAVSTMNYTGEQGGLTLFAFLLASVAVNAAAEAAAGLLVSWAVCGALFKAVRP